MISQMPQNVSEPLSEIAKPLPELTLVASILRPSDRPKGPSSTSPTKHVIETVQGPQSAIVPIRLPDPEPKEAKVAGRYCAWS